MTTIVQLSDETIAKIAAGEVIERPVNAVKELVENSIDSGARNIDVFAVDSGLTEITVTDDGHGMTYENLMLSFRPHTTSKISSVDDLQTVTSLGFRGEGLASLASISELTIASRNKKATRGYEINLKNGRVLNEKQIGMPVGTRVSALKLMESIPGRKKFLKSERTEFRHILDYISQIALSFPHVRFSLTHNNKKIVDFQGSLIERIEEVFSETVISRLLHTTEKNSLTTINMYISHPENALPTSNKLLTYVNNRPVQDALILSAIKEAYGKLLDPYSYPVGVIFVNIPPQFVDVNVHPTKRQIRFEGSEVVYQEIKENTQNVLSKYNLTFGSGSSFSTTNRIVAKEMRADVLKLPISQIYDTPVIDNLLIVDNTFIVSPHKEGLILFDQHAAHEALLFEAYSEAFKKHKAEHIELPDPIIVTLTHSEQILYEEHKEVLVTLGFQMEEFGGKSIKVSAIPKLVNEHALSTHISEILEYLASARYPDIDHLNNKMIAFLACKSAIKAGDRLTQTEAHKLIGALNERNSVYTCPHGRPVKRVISILELKKMFKRV